MSWVQKVQWTRKNRCENIEIMDNSQDNTRSSITCFESFLSSLLSTTQYNPYDSLIKQNKEDISYYLLMTIDLQ